MNRLIPYLLRHAATGTRRLASVIAVAIMLTSGLWVETSAIRSDSANVSPRLVSEPGDTLDDRYAAASAQGTVWAVRGADIQVVSERVTERKSGGGHRSADRADRGGENWQVSRLGPLAGAVERSISQRPLFYLHAALLI